MSTIDVEYRYTRQRVPRGARADAEKGRDLYLFKRVSLLRCTYQIRLLAFRAQHEEKRLIIRVPDHCTPSGALADFLRVHADFVALEKVAG